MQHGPGSMQHGELPPFYPVLQPGRQLYPEVHAGPGHPPHHHGDPRGGPPLRRPGGRFFRRPLPSRDIAIGCAIAALVVAAFVSAKFLVFGDEPRAEAEAAPTGTIAVVVRDAQPAEVQVDGKPVGTIRDRQPLTLSSLPPGRHKVLVTREGAPSCEQTVELASRQAKVVECSFPKADSHGRLVLIGLEPNHRVFVDDQEVPREQAREPLDLTPGVEHMVQVKTGAASPAVVEEFTIELEPGQEERRELKGAGGKDRQSRSRGSSSRRGDDDDDEDVDADDSDDEIDAEEESAPERRPRPRPGATPAPAAADALQPETEEPGSFTAYTQPFARVFIDGKDTGKMTPIAPRSAISVTPGTHVVTFVVGDQKYDFRITVAAGERTNLVKTLPPANER
jgi:hypothetical protein